MSNIYILEPPTLGKVLLKTTVGDIDIELWAKETPKACRNFVQLCLEGYYDNTVFHRVVKGFIAQGGDPSGDGSGGESIYGEPFKDEFHQRLKFVRRGLIAMANAGKDDNGSQFFFTLAATPELQNKHTIFGKVSGNTIFNVLKLEEGLIEDERPLYPHKILKTEVLNNPFSDIVPRVKEITVEKKKKKERKTGVKDFKLLSFGAEAEEDEEETLKVNEKLSTRGKSTHDVLDDPKLSSKTVEDLEKDKEEETTPEIDYAEQLENIRKKLKTDKNQIKKKQVSNYQANNDDDDFDIYDRNAERKKKFDEIKQEIQNVKREYHRNKLKPVTAVSEEVKEEKEHSEMFEEYKSEYDKYKTKTKALPKKGAGREEFTLDLLAKFKNKLNSVKEKIVEEENVENDIDDVDNDESWMSHKLRFSDDAPTLAKDANTKDDNWFEIYDPRNSLNKRRRGEPSYKEKK